MPLAVSCKMVMNRLDKSFLLERFSGGLNLRENFNVFITRVYNNSGGLIAKS